MHSDLIYLPIHYYRISVPSINKASTVTYSQMSVCSPSSSSTASDLTTNKDYSSNCNSDEDDLYSNDDDTDSNRYLIYSLFYLVAL